MAITQNPIIGRAKNQAGGMVFSKMYDKNVMRANPESVNNPKTPAQVKSREALAVLTEYAKQFPEYFLNLLYAKRPTNRSRYHELLKQLSVGRDVSGETGTIDFGNVPFIGHGIDALAGECQLNWLTSEWQVKWQSMTRTAESTTSCRVIFVFINHTTGFVRFSDIGVYWYYNSAYISNDPAQAETDDVSVFIGIIPDVNNPRGLCSKLYSF